MLIWLMELDLWYLLLLLLLLLMAEKHNFSVALALICRRITSVSFFINLYPQHTATTRLKLVAKGREATASPRVRTRPAPPARVHSGETMQSHLTSPPTDAPWSPPLLPAPLLPPHARDVPETHPAPLSLTPGHTAPCSRSRRETARNLGTLIRSGEVDVHWQVL